MGDRASGAPRRESQSDQSPNPATNEQNAKPADGPQGRSPKPEPESKPGDIGVMSLAEFESLTFIAGGLVKGNSEEAIENIYDAYSSLLDLHAAMMEGMSLTEIGQDLAEIAHARGQIIDSQARYLKARQVAWTHLCDWVEAHHETRPDYVMVANGIGPFVGGWSS